MIKRRPLKSEFLLREAKEAFDKPQISLEAIKKFRKAIKAAEADLVRAEEILATAKRIWKKQKEALKQ